jgi:hypothetical protein
MNKLILFFAFLGLAFALNCTTSRNCHSVTTSDNYVACISGVCQCLTNQGFDGLATLASPCDCLEPKDVYMDNNGPSGRTYNCIDVAATTANLARQAAMKQQVIQIYRNTIGVTLPYEISEEYISVAHLFAPNVKARVSPIGHLNGVTFKQFFYSLAAASNIVNVFFVDLQAEGNVVSVRIDTQANETGSPMFNLTTFGSFYFDPNNLTVIAADLILANWGKIQNLPSFAYPYAIAGICEVSSAYCTGVNQQYSSYADCVSFLTALNFGTYDQFGNTTSCRTIFTDMIPTAPIVDGANLHCPDIGRNSPQCSDTGYPTFYTNDIINPYGTVLVI